MNATITLLDKYKNACSLASDNACAIALGISRSAVSRWRHEGGQPEVEMIEKMCNASGEPLAKWLPLIEAERARNPAAKRVWLKLASVAATLVLAVYTAKSNAQDNGTFARNDTSNVYYVKLKRSKRLVVFFATRVSGAQLHFPHLASTSRASITQECGEGPLGKI